jgi:hypothetical protein
MEHWLEKDFDKRKKENEDKKIKCHVCGNYLEYERIGYLRYGFVCNNTNCHNDVNKNDAW